ncbi:hypothetical protein WCT84_21740, partial [Pectobacterium brasiliense]
LPPACSVSLGGNARGWVRAAQISNFCEIEFTRLTPRVNAREAQAFTRLNPPRLVLCLNGMLSAVSVAKIKRVGMSTPLESASREGYRERAVLPANNSILNIKNYGCSVMAVKKP